MKSDFSKLQQRQRTEEAVRVSGKHEQEAAREFATVDDLLRYDSDQNPAPPEIAERLNQSIAAEVKPAKPWFRRIFGG